MKLPLYAIVGDRPVKGVSTPEGGMDVLAYDWQTGEFVRDMSYVTTLMHPTDEDAEFVDKKTFDARVKALKAGAKVVYLRHHDLFDRLLAYHPDDGDFRELLRADKPAGTRLYTGFYLTVSGHVFGVIASAKGPVFFRDHERHLLHRGKTKVEFTAGVRPGVNRFRLSDGETEIANFEYTAPASGGTHPYDDEEMSDFFAWLASGLSQGGLFKTYTVEGEAALWDEPEPPRR